MKQQRYAFSSYFYHNFYFCPCTSFKKAEIAGGGLCIQFRGDRGGGRGGKKGGVVLSLLRRCMSHRIAASKLWRRATFDKRRWGVSARLATFFFFFFFTFAPLPQGQAMPCRAGEADSRGREKERARGNP